MKSQYFIAVLCFLSVSCQRNESRISGKIVGADGQPVSPAHVLLMGGTRVLDPISVVNDPVLVSEQAREDGTFSLSTRETGPFVLLFTAVGHKELIIPLPLERRADVSVGVRLASAMPDTSQSEIPILTTIDGGATLQRASLVKQSSGMFRADIATMGDSLMYIVLMGDPESRASTLIGATADRYELTPMNFYAGVVPGTNGHAIIEYHVPHQTVVARGMYRFHDSASTPAVFAGMQEKFKQYVTTSDSLLLSHLRSGRSFGSFKYPWAEIADTLARTAGLAPDGLLKDEMALETFECYSRARIPVNDTRIVQLIASVSPTSLAWVYHGTMGLSTKRMPELGDSYFASIVDRHP